MKNSYQYFIHEALINFFSRHIVALDEMNRFLKDQNITILNNNQYIPRVHIINNYLPFITQTNIIWKVEILNQITQK